MHKHSAFRHIFPAVLLFVSLSVFDSIEGLPGKFEKYAEQYKPIRDAVCGGKATKDQLTGLVKCMDEFKSSFKNMGNKSNEVKAIVQDCLAEGDKELTFEVDKAHQEFVYLMCSKKFGQCLHRQMPRFRPPGPPPSGPNGANATSTSAGGPPPGGPGGDQKVEAFIQCEKKVLGMS